MVLHFDKKRDILLSGMTLSVIQCIQLASTSFTAEASTTSATSSVADEESSVTSVTLQPPTGHSSREQQQFSYDGIIDQGHRKGVWFGVATIFYIYYAGRDATRHDQLRMCVLRA